MSRTKIIYLESVLLAVIAAGMLVAVVMRLAG